MAKDRERKTARVLFVEQKKTAVETARLVGVAPKTVGDWIEKFGWRNERDARNTSPANRIANIEQIIFQLAEDRIGLDKQLKQAESDGKKEIITELRSNISKIDDAVSKWNKTLQDIKKETKVSLSVYLEVMTDIFNAMQEYDPKLFMRSIEFQEKHVEDASLKLSL